MDDETKLPTQPGSPTSEHGQIMFAMGKMFGRLDAIDQKQAYANGRTGKLEDRIDEVDTTLQGRMTSVEKWQSTTDGKDIGISKLTLVIANIITLVVAIVALILKFVK
jgi:tetrahydromethanopterin S-methyltransferase subunit G